MGTKRMGLHNSKASRFLGVSLAVATIALLSCTGPAGDERNAFPMTCAEVQEIAVAETGGRPENGTYTLYVDGDERKPWEAYCHNMRRAEPLEYLAVEESANVSQMSDGTSLRLKTSYRRLRIDPQTLAIDPNDTTFGTTEVGNDPDALPSTDLPVGFAHFDANTAGGSLAALAKVDLHDTPFLLDEAANGGSFFCVETADKASDVSDIRVANDQSSVTLIAHNKGLEASTVAGGCASPRPLWKEPSTLAPWPLVWAGPPGPGRCTNGISDGRETDVDCGGNCTVKCAVSKWCIKNSDCVTNVCISYTCGAADAGTDGGTDANVDSGADATGEAGTDAGTDAETDAGTDAGTDASPDGGTDATVDSGPDASVDSGVDAPVDSEVDAGPDAPGESGADVGTDASLVGAKRIFTTAATFDGNLGGVAGADAKCQADTNRPNASTYKAMIVDGFYRVACTQGNENCAPSQHVGWVLAANTVYVRANGTTIIGTTNSAAIFPLSGATLTASFGANSATVYTGIGSDWTRHPGCGSYCDCTWFTSSSNSDRSSIGEASSLTSNAIAQSTANCATSHALYCVEQ
jgi:hypothetical protein